MRDYFKEMNIDYDELKRYEDIETYYDEVQDYTKLIQELQCDRVEALKQIVNRNKEIERLHSIIKEVREYITSYESIDTIQQNEHIENNKELDEKTMIEMVRRYLIVHDRILEIINKGIDKE